MLRPSYIGDASSLVQNTPLQAEARAYFAAMTTPPSRAWAEAVNKAIFDWKACGAWAKMYVITLLAAESAQASLLNMKDPATYAATLTGAPTFTAGKGYSNFAAGNRVNHNLPPQSGSGNGQATAVAGRFDLDDASAASVDVLKHNDNLATPLVRWFNTGSEAYLDYAWSGFARFSGSPAVALEPLILGHTGQCGCMPFMPGIWSPGAFANAYTQIYVNGHADTALVVDRWCFFAAGDGTTLTPAEMAAFLGVAAVLLDTLGALK